MGLSASDVSDELIRRLVLAGYEIPDDESGNQAIIDALGDCLITRPWSPPPTPRVILMVEGGVVGEVFNDLPVDVLLIDQDTDGVDDDALTSVRERDESTGFDAIVARVDTEEDAEQVNHFWDQIPK